MPGRRWSATAARCPEEPRFVSHGPGHGAATIGEPSRVVPLSWVGNVEQALGVAVALAAAAILLFEVGLLFAGVIARYFLHRPLVWADELASTLFVWLSALGAVLA